MHIKILLLVLVLSQCFVNAQNTNEKQDIFTSRTITLNQDSYGTYPAVILDLDTHELISFDETETEAEMFKGVKVKSGFFIEPGDPEFGAISSVSPEMSPKLVVLNQNKATITVEEAKKIEMTSTDIRSFKSGLIFLVKTFDEKFYKFQIIALNKEKDELKFKYELVE